MSPRIRSLLLATLASLAADAARAQEIAFQGIAWGTPADAVRARVEAMGFAPDRALENGDALFTRPDGASLRTWIRAGRVAGIDLVDAARGEPSRVRYHAIADSLAAVLGAPDEVTEEQENARERLWVAGLTSVSVEGYRIGSDGYVRTSWRGPGWHDEVGRRLEMPPVPPGYTVVAMSQFMRIAVDTTVRTARGADGLRGRFRIEYREPVVPPPNGGRQEEPFDVAEYEMHFDCAARRARLVSRATWLEGRRVSSNAPERQPWVTPQPDGHYARGLAAVCRAARGRR